MADLEKLKNNPKEQIWSHLDDVRFVMLGSPDRNQHMQPMAPQVDEEAGVVWFYTDKTTDLVRAVRDLPDDVHMCISESDYQACLRGSLSEHTDDDTIDRFWSSTVAAWFEGGRADENLTMLKFTPKDAAIWAETKNPVTFAWEIQQSKRKGRTPDVGDREKVDFQEGGAWQIND